MAQIREAHKQENRCGNQPNYSLKGLRIKAETHCWIPLKNRAGRAPKIHPKGREHSQSPPRQMVVDLPTFPQRQ